MYPFTDTESLLASDGIYDEIPIRNGGLGLALNVAGHLYSRTAQSGTHLLGTTLAGGDHGTVRLVQTIGPLDGA